MARDFKRGLSPLQRFAEGIILNLDAQSPVVPDLVESRHELCPIDLTKAGNSWRMPLLWQSKYSYFIKPVGMDDHIFGVQMKQLVLEVAQWTERVHLLENKV